MVMVTTVPAVCNKIMFTQGLNVRTVYSISVRFSVLVSMLDLSVRSSKKFLKLVNYIHFILSVSA